MMGGLSEPWLVESTIAVQLSVNRRQPASQLKKVSSNGLTDPGGRREK
jgi:hypothetical protein